MRHAAYGRVLRHAAYGSVREWKYSILNPFESSNIATNTTITIKGWTLVIESINDNNIPIVGKSFDGNDVGTLGNTAVVGSAFEVI